MTIDVKLLGLLDTDSRGCTIAAYATIFGKPAILYLTLPVPPGALFERQSLHVELCLLERLYNPSGDVVPGMHRATGVIAQPELPLRSTRSDSNVAESFFNLGRVDCSGVSDGS